MKQTVNQSAFIDAFHNHGRGEQFSYEALCAMFEYIEDYERDSGEEIELDVIALCCEWSEDEPQAIADSYGIELEADDSDSEKMEKVIEYLNDESPCALELNNGCILYVQF